MADDTRSLYPDELPPEAHVEPQLFYEEGPHTGSPGPDSTKVGWTLRTRVGGQVIAGFAFLINPQGISRVEGSRATVAATKGGFYADDFGPAPGRIQVRQLVASGKVFEGGFYTAREDVQRFLKRIYLPATTGNNRGTLEVFFHDHHFDRGFEQRVLFPPDALTVERSVELHGVWRIDLQMVGMEKYPFDEIEVDKTERRSVRGRRYTVRAGDTLAKLATRLAGKGASASKVQRVREQILNQNPQLKSARRKPDGSAGAKPMRVYPGEVLRLPA